jgi:hypothetical protein
MDNIPIWIKGLALALVMLLTVEAGYRLNLRVTPAKPGGGEIGGADGWGTLVTGTLTLLALLISFSVSMAVDRFENRRQLVVDEANAISTTYLRAQLLSEPARDRLSALIAHYARDRTALFLAGEDVKRVAHASAETEVDQDELWRATGDALRQPQDATLTTSLLQTTNQMFDLASARQAAVEMGVPRRVLLILIVYPIVTAGMVGFGLRAGGKRHLVGSTLFFLMVAMAVYLIMDLDQPRSGGILVSEASMDRVNAAIAKSEIAKARAVIQTPSGNPADKNGT